jgi:hypothetical protein
LSPLSPLSPFKPCGPCGPVLPGSPFGPVGSCPALKSLPSSEPSLTLLLVTALLLICLEPTLFFGNVTAAYETPPSARNNASDATILAYVNRVLMLEIMSPLDVDRSGEAILCVSGSRVNRAACGPQAPREQMQRLHAVRQSFDQGDRGGPAVRGARRGRRARLDRP